VASWLKVPAYGMLLTMRPRFRRWSSLFVAFPLVCLLDACWHGTDTRIQQMRLAWVSNAQSASEQLVPQRRAALTLASLATLHARSAHAAVPDYIRRQIPITGTVSVDMKMAFGALKTEDVEEASKDGDRTGASIWPGGLALATKVSYNQHLVKDQRVLELGCGAGLVGIAAVLAGAKSVTVTDGNPEILRLAEQNIRSNLPLDKQPRIDVRRLRWGNADDLDQWISEAAYDVVLASDVAYDRRAFPTLFGTIQVMLKQNPSAIAVLQMTPVVTDEGRGVQEVFETARSMGFVVQRSESEETVEMILQWPAQ